MSVEVRDDGAMYYPQLEPLTQEELDWLVGIPSPYWPARLGGKGLVSQCIVRIENGLEPTFEQGWALFRLLWDAARPLCPDCLAAEGQCDNRTCVRARVTNKLHLYHKCKEACKEEE